MTALVNDEILPANERYATDFAKGALPMPPGRKFAVVTCMDARLDPAKFLGLEDGDAHAIRNAGGIVTDDRVAIARDLAPPARNRGDPRDRPH